MRAGDGQGDTRRRDGANSRLCCEDHVPVAIGRDYQDVTPIRGIFLGGGAHTLTVNVTVEPGGPEWDASPA